MPANHKPHRVTLRNTIYPLLLTSCFSIAYAQSPLYTSNQNQYFLHAMAQAGVGYLKADWLANTLDPTPVFTFLVRNVYQITHWPPLFYIIYALLMGIYIVTLVGIMRKVQPAIQQPPGLLLLVALLVVIHSAAWRYGISRTVGINWTYIVEDGLADQRMLGPVLQPSSFGVLLLLGLYLYLNNHPYAGVIAAAAAATVHPTYLLSAALLTLAFMVDTWLERKRLLPSIAIGAAALLAVLPILAYAWLSFHGTTPELSARAREILITFRIPHHAQIRQWFDATALVKLAFILSAIAVSWHSKLGRILLVLTAVAGGLTTLAAVSQNTFLALIFPWRISILVLPVSTALLLAKLLGLPFWQRLLNTPKGSKLVRASSMGLLALAVITGGVRFTLDLQRKAGASDHPVENYISRNLDAGETYLTPVKMQDFRLVSGAPAYIDFKSIPYLDRDVLEWYQRVRTVDRIYKGQNCDLLWQTAQEAQLTHIVVPADTPFKCDFLSQDYADPAYSLMSIR